MITDGNFDKGIRLSRDPVGAILIIDHILRHRFSLFQGSVSAGVKEKDFVQSTMDRDFRGFFGQLFPHGTFHAHSFLRNGNGNTAEAVVPAGKHAKIVEMSSVDPPAFPIAGELIGEGEVRGSGKVQRMKLENAIGHMERFFLFRLPGEIQS